MYRTTFNRLGNNLINLHEKTLITWKEFENCSLLHYLMKVGYRCSDVKKSYLYHT